MNTRILVLALPPASLLAADRQYGPLAVDYPGLISQQDAVYLKDHEARQRLFEAEDALRASGSMGPAEATLVYSKPTIKCCWGTKVPAARTTSM